MTELQEKIAAVEASTGYDTLRDAMAFLQKEKIRRSDLAVAYGKKLLDSYRSWLGDDVWTIYEQTFLAALDTNDDDLAKNCLEALKKQFPSSLRVKRLEGMELEKRAEYTKAQELYKSILEENPANGLAQKRLIAIAKAKGDLPEAVTKLNAYIKNFQTDISAWQELADIYLSTGNFASAAFCFEELLLSNPLNFLFHLRLAEIYMTIGGNTNLFNARKHYIKSLELNPSQNLRSNLGLLVCTRSIAKAKLTKQEKEGLELNLRVHDKAMNSVQDLYEDQSTEVMRSIAHEVLKSEREIIQAASK